MFSKKYIRKTKIVATIGPASADPKIIKEMILSGLNVARLNFSHGTREGHEELIKLIRQTAKELGTEVGILQDLSGPKIRLGNIRDRIVKTGTEIDLVAGMEDLGPDSLPINYPYIVEDVNVGERILFADGRLEMEVVGKTEKSLRAKVLVGGPLSSYKGVNLPNSKLRVKAFTDKDKEDLVCGLEAEVDFVAMSFVRHENDLTPIIEMIARSGRPPLLIAKIEKPQALDRIDRILDVVSGIMVARGDLGVEMPIEDVPVIQKRLIQKARARAKVVITATQMLGSMTQNPRPTRAEVTDVANAILDGTDAVMLSDETAVGLYPVESVNMLDRVAKHTEDTIDSERFFHEKTEASIVGLSGSITKAVASLANDLGATIIVAATQTGNTARLLSHLRQKVNIVGLTPSLGTYRQLTLSWGVLPALIQPCDSMVLLEQLASEWLVGNKLAKKGDKVFLTCGLPLQISGTTNLIKMLDVGETSNY